MPSTLQVFYKVNYEAIGSLLIQDPKTDCNLNFESPHAQSSVTADKPFGCLVIDLDDGFQLTLSERGGIASGVRQALGLPGKLQLVGRCDCGYHCEVIKPGASIPLSTVFICPPQS